MSINNGVRNSAENFNAAFVSKTSDTGNNVTGKIGFQNTDPESGESIDNIQQEVNNKTFKPFIVQAISAGQAINSSTTLGMQRRKLVSSGGNISVSATPFGTGGGWIDGMQIRLVGTDDVNSVTIEHNDIDYGAYLNGDMTLTKHARLTLEWDADELRWIEIQRIG